LPSRTLPPGFIAPYPPTSVPQPPSGASWLHEIKHDGFPGHRPQDGQAGEALQPAGRAMT
jgi:hypothetical protein